MERQYSSQWKKHFESRLSNGRMIQKLFGRACMTNVFIGAIKHFPFLIKKMIKVTHGKEFLSLFITKFTALLHRLQTPSNNMIDCVGIQRQNYAD